MKFGGLGMDTDKETLISVRVEMLSVKSSAVS